jgi:hypothetical protein
MVRKKSGRTVEVPVKYLAKQRKEIQSLRTKLEKDISKSIEGMKKDLLKEIEMCLKHSEAFFF